MKNKKLALSVFILLLTVNLIKAQKPKDFEVKSPNENIVLRVSANEKLQWSVWHKKQQIIAPSSLSLQLQDGVVLGDKAEITGSKTENINTVFGAINYKKANIPDQCQELTINCKGDFSVIFRVYNDAVAYRFVSRKAGELIVKNEEANFNFTDDHNAFIPIQWDYRGGKNFNSSFEALYHEINLSQFPKDSLAFLPLLVDVGQNKKVVIL